MSGMVAAPATRRKMEQTIGLVPGVKDVLQLIDRHSRGLKDDVPAVVPGPVGSEMRRCTGRRDHALGAWKQRIGGIQNQVEAIFVDKIHRASKHQRLLSVEAEVERPRIAMPSS